MSTIYSQINKTLKGWLKHPRSSLVPLLGAFFLTLSFWLAHPDHSASATFLLTATNLQTGTEATPHIFTDSVLDLTANQSGFVNGAYIVRADLASGSGTNDSFLKLKATPEEEGYNTDAAVSQPDVTSARSLQLSELPQVTKAGETFREIRLDLNERNRASEIVLEEFRLFLGDSPTLSGYNPSNQTLTGALNGGQAVFDLGNSVLFDAALTSGSGSGDALFYIPERAFAGADDSTYVYLFAKLGSADKINGSDAGFEEFTVADMPGIDNDFGNRQEIDLEVVKTFIPTSEGQNIAIPDEEFSYTLTVTNKGSALAESVLITDSADLQLNVSELFIPAGAINLDTYDPDQDGTIDPYIAANGQSLTGDGNPDSVEVVIPSLSSGESAQLTVKTIVSNEYVQTNNIYASLGENAKLSEYNNTQVKGKFWLPVDKIDKVAGSSIVNVKQNIVGGQVSVAANGANVFESSTSNNTSADYGTIPFMRYIGTLSNGEPVRIYSDLFDPKTDDPLNPEYVTILDFDYCISTVTGQIIYDNCDSLIASGQAYNTSDFLPSGQKGAAGLHFDFDNKGLISLIPNEWNAFLALDTFTDPTAAQQIADFNQQLMEMVYSSALSEDSRGGADIFNSGDLELINPNTNKTERMAIAEAQVTPDFADNVIILAQSDDVSLANENLTPGTEIINYNDLQDALNTLAPATNSLSSLKIVIDSSVTTTRLTTLDLNALKNKGYLATDLEILGTTMTFDTQNGQGDIDLSQLNVIAPAKATVTLKGGNGVDTIKGSSLSEIIEGGNGGVHNSNETLYKL
ncbi:MAG: hypothetical protein RID53_17870 [Coleofasciculus sp. B1-GNL1-01]|uniref:hypothetical protein n=1 Tax=Coleofasciculus sp. B1-GNL1-01 TaxID=3068484 RepID=UPI0032FC5015